MESLKSYLSKFRMGFFEILGLLMAIDIVMAIIEKGLLVGMENSSISQVGLLLCVGFSRLLAEKESKKEGDA